MADTSSLLATGNNLGSGLSPAVPGRLQLQLTAGQTVGANLQANTKSLVLVFAPNYKEAFEGATGRHAHFVFTRPGR